MFDLSFDKYPTLLNFAASAAYIRGVIGPAGSAKTTYAFKELVIRSILQEPNPVTKVRPTKWFIIRNTFRQLRDNTIASYKTAIGPMFNERDVRENPTPKAMLVFPLPDGTMVQAQFVFVAMDNPKAVSDMLGAEMTGVLVDEASEISLKVIEAAQKRIGRYPSMADVPTGATWSGMILTTNGPKKNHWLYDWYTRPKPEWRQYEEEMNRPYFELFRQPAALLRPANPGDDWLPNPRAENIHNLKEGYGYYYKMLGDDNDSIIAYVEGDFADLKSGKVVFPEFNYGLHRIDERDVEVPAGAPIMLSFDFGRTPVCLTAICTEAGGLVVTDEVVGESMSIETLFKGSVKPVLKQRYSRSKILHAWGDPAGNDETQAIDISPFQVLRANNVPIEVTWATRNDMHPRLEAVRMRLTTLGRDGKPMLRISSRCKLLLDALASGYIYPEIKGAHDSEIVQEQPTKSHVNWVSDLADALQYLCLGFDSTYAVKTKDERVKSHARSRRSLLRRTR